MISEIIRTLQSKPFTKNDSLVIEIAKGKYELYTIKNIFTKIKRKLKYE